VNSQTTLVQRLREGVGRPLVRAGESPSQTGEHL